MIHAELESSSEDSPLYPRSTKQRSVVDVVRRSHDIIVALIACVGAMSFGFSLGYTSPALQDDHLAKLLDSPVRRSWFGSLMTLGAMAGGPLAATSVGQLGWKTTLMLCNVPLAAGWFLIIYNTSVALLYTGRFLTGIGVGAVCMAVPLYVAEVTAVSRRGPLGTAFQVLGITGVFVSYVVGSLVSWSWLAVVAVGLSVVHVVLLLTVPETPRWLLVNNDRQGAQSSLTWLRGTSDIDAEFTEMEDAIVATQNERVTLSLFLSRRVLKPLLISVALMFFQQATGINAVIFYTSQIFASAGFSSNPNAPTMIVGAVLLASVMVSCVISDVVGRRVLLLTSGTVMAASIATLGVYFYITDKHEVSGVGWLSLVSLLVYVAFFAIGWGPVPWVVTAEILPVRAKTLGGGLATASNWFFSFLVTKEFEDLELALHRFGVFWLFAGIGLIGVIFVFFYVPETRGRSLEEIEAQFGSAA